MDEASRVLELDSRINLKLSLMIINLVPIGKKKKKRYGGPVALCFVLREKTTFQFSPVA